MGVDGFPAVRVEIAADAGAEWRAVQGVLSACHGAHIFDTHLICRDDFGRIVRLTYWLPKDTSAPMSLHYKGRLIIRIRSEGSGLVYSVRDRSWPGGERAAMIDRLLAVPGAPREVWLSLKPAPDVRVEAVAGLMDELRAARFEPPLHCVLENIDAEENRRTWDDLTR